MLTIQKQQTIFGNLQSYKMYTLPTAKRLFGSYSYKKKQIAKHQENVQRMLKILTLNGKLTTWGMAKVELYDEISAIRVREKEYRRLLVGRKDRGKKAPGLLDVGLVIIDGKSVLKSPSNNYRLSLHGILYCLEVLDLTDSEIDKMALAYSKVLPMVFGNWDYLKSIVGNQVYRLKILASGIFLDNIYSSGFNKFPIYEIFTYLNIKYRNNFEKMTEKDLANQISFWFFTNLMIPPRGQNLEISSSNQGKILQKIFEGNQDLKMNYSEFVEEAKKFYSARFESIKNIIR